MTDVARQSVGFWRPGAPVLLCVVLVALVWGVHLSRVPLGEIGRYDEFYTLERSSSFATQGDWLTVYTGHEPNFRKPPLQYWMSAALMEAGVGETAALRLPSMVFALGCLFTVALLAAIVVPAKPWAMPASVLVYASSEAFWQYGVSAFLDAGATFFAMISLALSMVALRRPRWWYAVAGATALGALQKAPSALAVVVVFLLMVSLTSRWHDCKPRRFLRNPHFLAGAALALFGTVAWPLLQYLRYGAVALNVTYSGQMLDRFAPAVAAGSARGLEDLRRLIIDGEPVLRGLGIVSLLGMPWVLRRPDLLALPLVFLAFVAAMYFAGGDVYERYTLIVLPLLAVALVAVTLTLVPSKWAAVALVLAVSWVNEGPIKDNGDLLVFPSERMAERVAFLSEVGEAMEPEDTLLVCNWDSADRFPPGAVSVYASGGRPFATPRDLRAFENFLSSRDAGPLRGVCKPDQLEEVAARIGPVSIVGERFGYLHWTADGEASGDR